MRKQVRIEGLAIDLRWAASTAIDQHDSACAGPTDLWQLVVGGRRFTGQRKVAHPCIGDQVPLAQPDVLAPGEGHQHFIAADVHIVLGTCAQGKDIAQGIVRLEHTELGRGRFGPRDHKAVLAPMEYIRPVRSAQPGSHQDLVRSGFMVRTVTTCADTSATTRLVPTAPNDHVRAIRSTGHMRVALRVSDVLVHQEFVSDGCEILGLESEGEKQEGKDDRKSRCVHEMDR